MLSSNLSLADEIVFSIKKNAIQSTTISVSAPAYYRGVVNSDKPLESASIIDEKSNTQKIILSHGVQNEIFWFAQHAGRYQLLAKSGEDDTNVTVDIHSLALKDDQYVSPKRVLLSPRLTRLASEIKENKHNALSQFWQEIEQTGSPLVEDGQSAQTKLVTFLWRGPVENVRLLGAPYVGHDHLTELGSSNVWYASYEIPSDSRLSYRLAPNVPQLQESNWMEQRRAVLATAGADPLNHEPLFAQDDVSFGVASTLTLKDAPSDVVTQPTAKYSGKVENHNLTSTILGNSRKVSTYMPNARYPLSSASPLLIVFDGDDYLSKVPTSVILDNLIESGAIPPMAAVFVNPALPSLRGKELTPNAPYGEFLTQELKPWVCKTLNVCPSAENTILTGSSFGGLASMYYAFTYPEEFGNVLSQSGSFWWSPKNIAGEKHGDSNTLTDWMRESFDHAEKKPITIYMNAGRFETQPASSNILQANTLLYQTLINKDYSVRFDVVSGGHDYFSWRVSLADGLTYLFGQKTKN